MLQQMIYPFKKLTIQSDNPGKEAPELTNILIPPPEASSEIPTTDMVKTDNSMETHYKMLTEQEVRLQREEEKYAIYISMLSEEEDSDTETDTDETTYSYFD